MVRKLFLTPPDVPEDTVCRGLVMPASQAWLGVFSKALLSTIYAYNYEQIHETDLTPEQAAETAYAIYTAWLSAECAGGGSDCELPNGAKVYRRNPTSGKFEYLEDGAWVEDEDIPLPEPREESTPEERLCLASVNAVNVLHLLYDDVLAMWDDEIAVQTAIVDFWTTVGILIGSAFVPALIGILALEELAFALFYRAMDALSEDMWDEDFEKLLICLFQQNASEDEDERVHFDWQSIQEQLFTRAFVGETWLLQAAQVAYIAGAIGNQGLDTAGATTDIDEYDCECGSWYYESSDFSAWQRLRGGLLGNGQTPVTNTLGNAPYGLAGMNDVTGYAEFRLRFNTSASTITRFAIQCSGVGAMDYAHVPVLGIGTLGTATDNLSAFYPANYSVPVWKDVTGNWQYWQTELYYAGIDGVVKPMALKWRVEGTGINPFIGWP